MASEGDTPAHTLFDFGPLARKYDRWYATSAGMAHDPVQKADVRRFLGRAAVGSRLLDVGCGTGHWSRFFAALGYTVVAVDVSQEMIAVAHGQGPAGIAFQVANACALPFRDASFDVAAAMATLEFLVSPLEALREMARCVRRGGRILIGTLNRSAPLNRQRLAEGHEPYASGRLYSPEDLLGLLRSFGRVEMVASDPDHAPSVGDPGEPDRAHSGTGLDGPFIIAEVQR